MSLRRQSVYVKSNHKPNPDDPNSHPIPKQEANRNDPHFSSLLTEILPGQMTQGQLHVETSWAEFDL